jgi:hypothetical protein
VCSSKPKKPAITPPRPADPPAELLLDEAGSARRAKRTRAGALKSGRRGLRIDVSTPAAGGSGLAI